MRLLNRLAMVSLRIRKAEESLLEKITTLISTVRNPFHLVTYSFSFQKAKVMFWRPWVSETPAIPSSPHRYARERDMSWEKS